MSGIRHKLEDKIRRKESEIQDLERQIAAAREYVKATQEALTLVIRDGHASGRPHRGFKAGSNVAKAFKFLKKETRPYHIADLLEKIGKANNKSNRAALASQLSAYAKNDEIFSKPAPNTFGLVEWGDSQEEGSHGVESDQSMDAARL